MKINMKSISEALGVSYDGPTLEISKDEIYELSSNYRTYGGGRKGQLNGFYGKRHTDESKNIMKKRKLGYIPWNVGVKGYSVHNKESKKLISEGISGSNNGRSLLNENDVLCIIKEYKALPDLPNVGKIQSNGRAMSYEWSFCNEICKKYNVNPMTIKKILRKQNWKNVWSKYESEN